MNKKAIEFNEDTDITTNVKGKKNTVFDDLISTNISKYQSFSENNSNNKKRKGEIIDRIKDTLRHKQCRFVYQKDGSYYEQGNESKIREKIQNALKHKTRKHMQPKNNIKNNKNEITSSNKMATSANTIIILSSPHHASLPSSSLPSLLAQEPKEPTASTNTANQCDKSSAASPFLMDAHLSHPTTPSLTAIPTAPISKYSSNKMKDCLHFKPRQQKTKKHKEIEATSALLMLAGNDSSSSSTSNNNTSNTTNNTNTTTITTTNSTNLGKQSKPEMLNEEVDAEIEVYSSSSYVDKDHLGNNNEHDGDCYKDNNNNQHVDGITEPILDYFGPNLLYNESEK